MDDLSNAISFGNASSSKTYLKYLKFEFVFGVGVEVLSCMLNVGEGFVFFVFVGLLLEVN